MTHMTDIARRAAVPAVTLGWRLRMALDHADIKADEMADALHVHRSSVTRWCHDVGSPPRMIYLERWADITGVALDWLAGDLVHPPVTRAQAGGRAANPRRVVQAIDNRQEPGRDTHWYSTEYAYSPAA